MGMFFVMTSVPHSEKLAGNTWKKECLRYENAAIPTAEGLKNPREKGTLPYQDTDKSVRNGNRYP